MIRLLLLTLLTTNVFVTATTTGIPRIHPTTTTTRIRIPRTATTATLKMIPVTSIPVTTMTLKTTTQLDQPKSVEYVTPELNSSILHTDMKTEVISDSAPIEIKMDDVAHISLSETETNSNEGENKIETKHDTGDAPKINEHVHEPMSEPTELLPLLKVEEAVPGDDEEYANSNFDSSTASATSDEGDDVEIEKNSEDDVTSTTSTSEASATTPTPDSTTSESTTTTTEIPNIIQLSENNNETTNSEGVVLPTDDQNERDNDTYVDKPFNGDIYPLTFLDRTNNYIRSLTEEPGRFSAAITCVLFTVIVILLFLVARECCKSKRRFSSINRRDRNPPSVTSDLYNTSDCSHFYQKPTLLLNQQEVTMQLVSSDVSTDDIV
ncbi:hypothetical protein CRE_20897 [Caenorhabditis remanei]|uniref:Uncharacterized protein n=1 Tax=Caenorhabditis remanei TaxID=31234 RepID=E3N3R8_CAERE|nr:hypothetical protein CRE_20897 [Caenorhabditis remanei]